MLVHWSLLVFFLFSTSWNCGTNIYPFIPRAWTQPQFFLEKQLCIWSHCEFISGRACGLCLERLSQDYWLLLSPIDFYSKHYWALFKMLWTTIRHSSDHYSKHYRPLFKTLSTAIDHHFKNTADHYSKHHWPQLATIQNTIHHYWQLFRTLLTTVDHY